MEIDLGNIKKVVLSRSEEVAINTDKIYLQSIQEDIIEKKVTAIIKTNNSNPRMGYFSLVLWEGRDYDNIGNWKDNNKVETRIKELLQ